MRKHQQRQILNLLQTIKRAQSLHLYADCRESAAGIRDFIDSIEGKGTQTAKLLAEYGELLPKAGNRLIGKQQLQKHLAMIENSVNHELKPPDKIEVAFFPYNASKFDSLESIYLAARNDPQCDAYVVPIPYYNLLPGGKFGQMHYEGHLYPDNIPITDWREYNVEVRNPDIIFIHTPYDEDNLVTSIHPDFYSKRLKNFTGLLVYVPYFVCIDDVPEWLCVHCGTVYADKIIVQSEKVKQTYLRVFKEFGKENNCEKIFGNLEDKIVTIGSPKFDRALNTKREDCILPDNWRTLIERPDDTCKKIIFYNTSLSSLLQGNETYLKKLQSVLAHFRERDDVVLWWRPHPLSKNTYQAMRPHLLDEYERIVADYRHEGWGIYDDTPDLHRAIAWSDAYYGDASSIVALYQVTKKPIVYQDTKPIRAVGICDCGKDLYIIDTLNMLYKYDKIAGKYEIAGVFGNECAGNTWMMNIDCISIRNKLYFAPRLTNIIHIYDLEKSGFTNLRLNSTSKTKWVFSGLIAVDEYVYFVPSLYPAIVRIHAVTGETEYFSDWVDDVETFRQTPADTTFFKKHICAANSELFFLIEKTNGVLIFNTKTLTHSILQIGDKSEDYGGICHAGNKFWLVSGTSNYVTVWQRETNELRKIFIPDELKKLDKNLMNFRMVFLNDFIYLLPHGADKAYKINTITEEIKREEILEKPFTECDQKIRCWFAWAQGNMIYLSTLKNGIYSYDTSTSKLNHLALKPREICLLMSRLDNYNPTNYNNLIENMSNNIDGTAGKAIYEYCIRMVKE